MIVLNLQSYAGGKNPWGNKNAKGEKGEQGGSSSFVQPQYDDGLLDVVASYGGWHMGLVMAGVKNGVRLAQTQGVKIQLTGSQGHDHAYLQIDGEPWLQPLDDSGDSTTVISLLPDSSSRVLACLPRDKLPLR